MSQIPTVESKFLSGKSTLPGIIIFHAYTGTPNDVYALARKINRSGYPVLLPLFPGHGTKNIYDLLDEDVLAWYHSSIEAVKWMKQQNFPKIFVFGLSLGGIMASAVTADQTLNIDAGGIINSPIIPNYTMNLEPTFMEYSDKLYKAYGDSWQRQYNDEEVRKLHNEQLKLLNDFKFDLYSILPLINQPFYVAQSGLDELINPTEVNHVLEALPNAEIDYHYFPENTHVITINRNRTDFETSILHFIQKNT